MDSQRSIMGKVIDIDQMGQEELENAKFDEETGDLITPEGTEKDQKPDEKPEGVEKPEESEKPEEKTKDAEPEEKSLDEQIAELETVPKDERSEVQALELRRLNAERKMHQVAQEKKQIEDRLSEREARLKELEESQEEDEFIELPESEEKLLKEEDPEEYQKYSQDKQRFVEKQNERVINSAKATYGSLIEFFKETHGIDAKASVDDVSKMEEFKNYMKSEEFQRLDRYLSEYVRPTKDGSYDLDRIKAAHRVTNYDKIIANTKVAGRKEALEDITKTKNSDTSKFQRATSGPGENNVHDHCGRKV